MPIDYARRKAVMSRSMKLGHCVCNPRTPCPCETFRLHNVCPCAGEKMPVAPGSVPLTHHVRKAGCDSKISQADLLRLLSGLPQPVDPNVLLGSAAGDDAGVYRIADNLYLVQTVDVFTPCVDDPYLFGRIAAANSLSDVYAMGGQPLTALSIVGFPTETLDGELLRAMVRGGIDTLQEAGCSLIGGHSIQDEEIKCGFAVTGIIEGAAPILRAAAKPGDALVLTKPLGTGMIAFAAQIGRATSECLNQVGAAMATLNRDAAELMVKHGAHACTDITGFGLAGHLAEMVRGSGVDAEIDLARVPVYGAAATCIEQDILSGAIERNRDYALGWVALDGRSPQSADETNSETREIDGERNLAILFDPQTSGGLLVSLPEEAADEYVNALRERGHGAASRIGRIVEKQPDAESRVRVGNFSLSYRVEPIHGILPKSATHSTSEGVDIMNESPRPDPAPSQSPCCDHPPEETAETPVAEAGESGAGLDAALEPFRAFMKAANAPGRIDRRAKKLMAVALSITHKCEPCLKTHLRSARAMGIPREELDEAATLAIAFGGCTAMMFYKEIAESVFSEARNG